MGYLEKAIIMAVYAFLTTVICAIIVFTYAIIWKKGRRIKFEDILLIIVLIVVSSLRYDVGSDYIRYMESAQFAARRFSDLHTLFSIETLQRYSFEVGYETLAVLTNRIFDNKYAIFWVVSIILYIPVVSYCRKYTDNSRIAVAIFLLFGFWGLTLNILKQAIAMVIILYIYEALDKKKYVVVVTLTIVAISFHITALIAVAGLLIIHFGLFRKLLEPTQKNLLMMIGIGVLFKLGTQILIRILSHFDLFSKYLVYATAGVGDETSRKYIWIGALIETAFVYFIISVAIKKKKKLIKINPKIETIISIIMLGIPFSILGISRTLWLANRFAKFFYLFIIVLLPTLLTKGGKFNCYTIRFNNRIVFWFALIIWHALYSVLMLDNNGFMIQTYLF